jgi:hypothetical protein
MQYYETAPMTKKQAVDFIYWFETNIGTDYEENELDDNEVYLLFSDLTPSEVKKIRAHEKEMFPNEQVPV